MKFPRPQARSLETDVVGADLPPTAKVESSFSVRVLSQLGQSLGLELLNTIFSNFVLQSLHRYSKIGMGFIIHEHGFKKADP